MHDGQGLPPGWHDAWMDRATVSSSWSRLNIMQTTSKTLVLVLWTLAAGLGAERASAVTISHTYWGAQPGVYSSVTHKANPYNYPNQATIGHVNQFGITDMQVSI